jgi:hypothetical protein
MYAHQPGSQPLDIPEAIPNPAVPQPTPAPSPAPKEPAKVPAPVEPSFVSKFSAAREGLYYRAGKFGLAGLIGGRVS